MLFDFCFPQVGDHGRRDERTAAGRTGAGRTAAKLHAVLSTIGSVIEVTQLPDSV